MRKVLMTVFAVLLVAAFALPVAAVPISDFATLAGYYPSNAIFFVGFRTDQPFIDTLDSLVSRIDRFSNPGSEGRVLLNGLDGAVQDMTRDSSTTFLETFRPLLGDKGAFGTLDAFPLLDDDPENNDKVGYGLVLEINDRAGVTALLNDLIAASSAQSMFVSESTDEADTFVPADDSSMPVPYYFYVGNDVLLIGNSTAALSATAQADGLAANADFTDSMGSLPNGDYNVVSYIALGPLVSVQLAEMQDLADDIPEVQAQVDMLESLYASYGGFALGFTILDDVHLTADFYVEADASGLMESMGIDPAIYNYMPADPAFAARVPANATAVILGANLGGSLSGGIASTAAMFSTMEGGMGGEVDIEAAINQINFVLRGATGLTLEEIAASLNGQFALGLTVDTEAVADSMMSGGDPSAEMFGFGVVFENVDGGLNALYDGLAQALTQFVPMAGEESGVTLTEIEGGLSINIPPQGNDLPFPLTIQLALNDSVMVLGTPDYVAQAFSGDGGLGAQPAFQNALTTLLPGSPSIAYLAPSSVQLIDLAAFGVSSNSMGGNDMQMSISSLIESLNLSANVTTEGIVSSTGRAVITLLPSGE
jgi:hypothetical protein